MRCPVHVGQEMAPLEQRSPRWDLVSEEFDRRIVLKCPITGCKQVALSYDAERKLQPRCSRCRQPFTRDEGSHLHQTKCRNCRREYARRWKAAAAL